jgi:hydrophobic/amphiphilic exporter-1 (mainly G- bacteria), HAE1 family
LRLRPILMTSFAFVLGCVPLAMATGSGAVSRQILGTVVIGGMLAATLVAVFIIPALFYMVERVTGRGERIARLRAAATQARGAPAPPISAH